MKNIKNQIIKALQILGSSTVIILAIISIKASAVEYQTIYDRNINLENNNPSQTTGTVSMEFSITQTIPPNGGIILAIPDEFIMNDIPNLLNDNSQNRILNFQRQSNGGIMENIKDQIIKASLEKKYIYLQFNNSLTINANDHLILEFDQEVFDTNPNINGAYTIAITTHNQNQSPIETGYLIAEIQNYVSVRVSVGIAPPTEVIANCKNNTGISVDWTESLSQVNGYNVYYKLSSESNYNHNLTVLNNHAVLPEPDTGEQWDILVRSFASTNAGTIESRTNCDDCELLNHTIVNCSSGGGGGSDPDNKNDEAEIIIYSFVEQTHDALIDRVNRTVEIEVQCGTSLENLIAYFTISPGAIPGVNNTWQDSGVTANNFSDPLVYVITSENGNIQNQWTIFVSVADCLGQPQIIGYPEKRIPRQNHWNSSTILEVLNPGTDTVIYSTTFDLDENGEYNELNLLSAVGEGTYDIGIKAYSHLRYLKKNIIINQDLTILDFTDNGETYLLAGDVDGERGDNIITVQDICHIVSKIYTNNQRMDLNQESLVNALDIGIALDNFQKRGDTEIIPNCWD